MKSQESLINAVKVWVFPSIVTLLSMMIWQDVRQIQEDIKQLMARSNIDKTRIDNLERRVNKLEDVVLLPRPASQPNPPADIPDNRFTSFYIREDEVSVPKPKKNKA